MQDMSCLISEPAKSPPRLLRSDVLLDKSVVDAKEKKTRTMPKTKDRNQAKEITTVNQEKKKQLRSDNTANKVSEESCKEIESNEHNHVDGNQLQCKMCDVTFTTNGGMQRHMKIHKRNNIQGSDTDDSEGSSGSKDTNVENESPKAGRKRRNESNNNESSENHVDGDQSPIEKKKSKTINNNIIDEAKLKCFVCDREDFATQNVLETHIEDSHPEYQIKCISCNLSFKNHRALNLHRSMVHYMEQSETNAKKTNINSVSGFNDCTFIDFSSQKFPEIAKTVCELSVHKSVTEQKFRCVICSRDFPCESALEIHAKTCCTADSETMTSESSLNMHNSQNNETIRRDDFFANLDLQNKSPSSTEPKKAPCENVKPPRISNDFYVKDARRFVDNTKDLADIQSILSVTSTGGLLEQLTQKTVRDNLTKDQEQEEVQDAFAAEFRKMKLRGEFPCRLCPAIFPNLRALKGHNRVHLSGNGAGPYRCNMCPHSSLDKAALVRHMRTHNGDRPYECAVCNYAFTTKANCERHLRNRHSKVTRDEVKRSIIYHPSEDPNNDEINNKLNISREDIKRSHIYPHSESDRRDDNERVKNERLTPVTLFPRETSLSFQEHGLSIPIPKDLSIVIPQPRDLLKSHCSIDTISKPAPISEDVLQPRIKVKGFGQLSQIPKFTESENEKDNYSDEEIDPIDEPYGDKMSSYSSEIPMDLSTYQEDVLDLSKKKKDQADDKSNHESESDDYMPKTIEYNNNAITANMLEKTQQFLLARHQLLKGVPLPKIDTAANIYQLSQLYSRGAAFPGLGIPPAFFNNPYFLPPNPFMPPTTPQNIVEMNDRIQKEIIRGLQLSGGGLVGMDQNIMNNLALAAAKERLQAYQQQNLNNMNELNSHTPNPVVKTEEDSKPQQLHVNTDIPTTVSYPSNISSPVIPSPKSVKKETISSQSPNSVKMVIKNGVLMPKQKQRRYRTERPFSCEHCSARFTLRSNMERHIKQQHPQYWSQRQRASLSGLPRKAPISLVPQNITIPQNISLNYDNRLNFMKNVHSVTDTSIASQENESKSSSPKSPLSVTPPNKNFNIISDQVKYAILAQQLKSQNALSQSNEIKNRMENIANGENEDEDEEDALVIDEETAEDKTQVTKPSLKTDPKDDPHTNAKKVAQEILITVQNNHEITKDFDWKIAGNLISKNIRNQVAPSEIPTFVSQIGSNKTKEDQTLSAGKKCKSEEGDLVSVSKLLDNAASQDPFGKYFNKDFANNSEAPQRDNQMHCEGSEEDEEGLVASSGSTSEGNNSGSDENKSESETTPQPPQKKKSAYSLAPNRVSCPYCHRKFPWSSSLRRHVLTHTGQKPYKCPHCPLLFTTKSNCDRHLLRKHGSSSQQTIQQSASNVPITDSSNNIPIPELGNQGFMMRNVPERPYKCASCPSSTFSTLSNLKKHMSFKHDVNVVDSHLDSPKNEESHSRRESYENDHHLSSDSEKSTHNNENENANEFTKGDWENQISSSKCSPINLQDVPSNVQNSDLPFKCHLCEGSYAERQVALDHIKESHESEFELLMCKGALESGITFGEDLGSSTSGHRSEGGEEQGSEENIEQLRGKFPDYANRKVVCAFCMRRFWSAEDLRRHMRTHTGERPFSCDVCNRRFTLKHSMLRHRKKHSSLDNRGCEELSMASGDEDAPSPNNHSSIANSTGSNRTVSPLPNNYSNHPNTSTPISKNSNFNLLNAYQISIHTKNSSSSPEIPSNVNNNNSPPSQVYEGKLKLHSKRDLRSRNRYTNEDNDGHENEVESGGDLIGNLLGISDRGMINKLLSSADEAAKLLGVNK